MASVLQGLLPANRGVPQPQNPLAARGNLDSHVRRTKSPHFPLHVEMQLPSEAVSSYVESRENQAFPKEYVRAMKESEVYVPLRTLWSPKESFCDTLTGCLT